MDYDKAVKLIISAQVMKNNYPITDSVRHAMNCLILLPEEQQSHFWDILMDTGEIKQ